MANNETDLNKSLKPNLKKINDNYVRMNTRETKRHVEIVDDVVDSFAISMMAVDPLFNELFQKKIFYAGSFYERVRVKSPKEFDVDVVLKLPFAEGVVEVSSVPDAPAFMELSLKRSKGDKLTAKMYKTVADFFDEDDKLLRTEILEWIQSVTLRAKKSKEFKLPSKVISLTNVVKGPAVTYKIKTTLGTVITLDLIPVIDCEKYSLPDTVYLSNRFNQLSPEAQVWFLVPKRYTNPRRRRLNVDTYWRIAFPEAEKELLKSEGCVKMLFTLLKLLRDYQNWYPIFSYYVKTLFLLELDKNSEKSDWLEADLGTLFMKMLRKLRTAVRSRNLKYYFDREANLMNCLTVDMSRNILGGMNTIIRDIEKDPQNLTKYLPKTHRRIYRNSYMR